MYSSSSYTPPLSLTILGAIFLLLGVICVVPIAVDILLRRGWKSMMGIMIPVYLLTPLYLGPIGTFFYFRYGRAAPPGQKSEVMNCQAHDMRAGQDSENQADCCEVQPEWTGPRDIKRQTSEDESGQRHASDDKHHAHRAHCAHHADLDETPDASSPRTPSWVTVFAGVLHCGAGCALGDVVGEWLVYGTNATISGRTIWPEVLIDYAFALLFGIVFQYFSIAPMSGQWGPMTFMRAAKADIVSLTAFQVGLFGWMVIYEVAIWDYKLGMVTTTYWWMMQIGMILGFATSYPVNVFLIRKGIKEPCV